MNDKYVNSLTGQSLTEPESPRVLRGGSWYNNPDLARAVFRLDLHPDLRHDGLGFRVLRQERKA